MVSIDLVMIIVLNSVAFAMVLFLLAAGLELMFGVMNIINLAHGSFYVMGSYIGVVVLRETGNFGLAVLAGMAGVAVLGLVSEILLFRRAPDILLQVLLTFGIMYILSDVTKTVWGGQPFGMPPPAVLAGSVNIMGQGFPIYRLALIFIGLLVALGLYLFQEKTRIGAIIRAGVDDKQMVGALGINIKLLSTAVFTLGSLLAGFAGVLGCPVINVYLGLDWVILILALVVLVVGGIGSLKGALIGSLLIGLADGFGKILFPQFAMFLTFAVMAFVLVIKPTGLFGTLLRT